MTRSLRAWGWKDAAFPAPPAAQSEAALARVVEQQKGGYTLMCEAGELWAVTAGRMAHDAGSRIDLPAVGDWVWAYPAQPGETALIHGIVSRRTMLSRLDPGERSGEEQPLAANVDLALLVTSLNKEFKAARLERYGAIIRKSGIELVVILNKADLCPESGPYVRRVEEALPGARVMLVSALEGTGLEALEALLPPAVTAVFLGSSGVGKSTLMNRLISGSPQATQSIRAAGDSGRHTTSARSLRRSAKGALLIDTPGLRQVALGGEDDLAHTFEDIQALADRCRFRDCSHKKEPGCAVQEALKTEELSDQRYQNYVKRLRAQAFLKRNP